MRRQLELYLDNAAWSKIKVLLHNLHEFLGGLGPGPVVEDSDGEGLGHPDGVGDLDQAPPAQAGGHQALGHPAGSVGGAPVHLGQSGPLPLVEDNYCWTLIMIKYILSFLMP